MRKLILVLLFVGFVLFQLDLVSAEDLTGCCVGGGYNCPNGADGFKVYDRVLNNLVCVSSSAVSANTPITGKYWGGTYSPSCGGPCITYPAFANINYLSQSSSPGPYYSPDVNGICYEEVSMRLDSHFDLMLNGWVYYNTPEAKQIGMFSSDGDCVTSGGYSYKPIYGPNGPSGGYESHGSFSKDGFECYENVLNKIYSVGGGNGYGGIDGYSQDGICNDCVGHNGINNFNGYYMPSCSQPSSGYCAGKGDEGSVFPYYYEWVWDKCVSDDVIVIQGDPGCGYQCTYSVASYTFDNGLIEEEEGTYPSFFASSSSSSVATALNCLDLRKSYIKGELYQSGGKDYYKFIPNSKIVHSSKREFRTGTCSQIYSYFCEIVDPEQDWCPQ